MITTMAALMGRLPIVVGFGAGADSRRGLGLAVVGGLLFSQGVTLNPVYYMYPDKLQAKIRKWKSRRKAEITHVPEQFDEWGSYGTARLRLAASLLSKLRLS